MSGRRKQEIWSSEGGHRVRSDVDHLPKDMVAWQSWKRQEGREPGLWPLWTPETCRWPRHEVWWRVAAILSLLAGRRPCGHPQPVGKAGPGSQTMGVAFTPQQPMLMGRSRLTRRAKPATKRTFSHSLVCKFNLGTVSSRTEFKLGLVGCGGIGPRMHTGCWSPHELND
jgi:hypothetical protein